MPYLFGIFFGFGKWLDLKSKTKKSIYPGCLSIRTKYTFVFASKPRGGIINTTDIQKGDRRQEKKKKVLNIFRVFKMMSAECFLLFIGFSILGHC